MRSVRVLKLQVFIQNTGYRCAYVSHSLYDHREFALAEAARLLAHGFYTVRLECAQFDKLFGISICS